jgi:hypothetical protein
MPMHQMSFSGNERGGAHSTAMYRHYLSIGVDEHCVGWSEEVVPSGEYIRVRIEAGGKADPRASHECFGGAWGVK